MSFEEDIRAAADAVRSCEEITIISHIDADGISSESILAQALLRQGIHITTKFVRQLDPLTLDQIPDEELDKLAQWGFKRA